MKTGKLSAYLDLIKSTREQGKLLEAKRLGETVLKKLPRLAASPREKFILYHRLGVIYYLTDQYSGAIDNLHKAVSIALKHHLPPEYLASVSNNLLNNFLQLNNINLALLHAQRVEQYYRKYGFKKPPLDLYFYLSFLIRWGFCYLYRDNLEKTREIIEEKIPPYQSKLNRENSVDYHKLKGCYLMAIKDYAGARLSFQESVRLLTEDIASGSIVVALLLNMKIYLAIISILEDQVGSAIALLKNLLKEAGQLKNNPKYHLLACKILLLLNKSYAMIGLNKQALATERRIKSRLKEVDTVWFYEFSKEVDRLYQQLETSKSMPEKGSAVVSRMREYLNGRLSSRRFAADENRYAIIGNSPAVKEVYELIEKVAPTNLPILIYGETGTGKELVARAIHQKSLRSQRTWLACNTGAIPETLLESELFGYIKGAFTGAQTDKKGYIELASEGTLFLDEIGSMSLGMQQKLLRVMEDNQLWRVGAEKPISVNTRFVFAGNEDLDLLVKEKRFREDLLYRINTIIINLPPLRERKEDIPFLIQHFLRKCLLPRQGLPEVSSSALALLTNYPWPGNVRELENEIKRICVMYPQIKVLDELMITGSVRNFQPGLEREPNLNLPLKELMNDYQRDIIRRVLQKNNSRVNKTAVQLGLTRRHLYRLMKQLQITTVKHTN